MLSVAVNVVTEIGEVLDAGRLKAVTVGAVVSGTVTLTVSLKLLDTLPAASFAQA